MAEHSLPLNSVLRGLPDETLTKVIVMDSMDCESCLTLNVAVLTRGAGFDPIPPSTPLPPVGSTALDTLDTSPEAAYEHLRSELDFEILEMRRVLKVGGHAVWRSAGKKPWYTQRFELAGFKVECIDVRENGKGIDRVNMYASCTSKPPEQGIELTCGQSGERRSLPCDGEGRLPTSTAASKSSKTINMHSTVYKA